MRYRLIVLSRNLTFDRSWDVALVLDGELIDRKNSIAENRPLSDFVLSLPGMARAAGTALTRHTTSRVQLLGDEVKRVRWELPDGFDALEFCPIGHDGQPSNPVYDFYRLVVIAPFVSSDGLRALADEVRHELLLVGRFEELIKLPPEDLALPSSVYVFDDPASLLEIGDEVEPLNPDDNETATELSGLHAKIFAGERNKRAAVFVGSANATKAAFDHNVEFLVELEGSRNQHGVHRLIEGLDRAGLLTKFKAPESPDLERDGDSVERELERLAHGLACGKLRAVARDVGDNRWRVAIYAPESLDFHGFELSARPISTQMFRPVDLSAVPCCDFPPTGRMSVTPFFAMRLTGRKESIDFKHDFLVRLPVEGLPEGRAEAVTADLLSDRDRLLRFMLLILGDQRTIDRALDELAGGSSDRDSDRTGRGRRRVGLLGMPLLEPMLRALHSDPQQLDEIAALMRDLEEAGANHELVPPELRALWDTVDKIRQAQ